MHQRDNILLSVFNFQNSEAFFFVCDPMQTSARDSRYSDEDTDTRSVSQASESDTFSRMVTDLPLDTI